MAPVFLLLVAMVFIFRKIKFAINKKKLSFSNFLIIKLISIMNIGSSKIVILM